MCSTDGFNLTKFISNNKLVLISIQKNYGREDVKAAGLVNEKLSTERVLGVKWSVEKD